MTTKVSVDAHAGWPVKVEKVQLDNAGIAVRTEEEIVPPHTTKDFYVHSHMELHIKEMPNT